MLHRSLALSLLLSSCALADELSDAFDALKKAMEAKNAADVQKWAAETSRLARPEAAKPQPGDPAEVEYWKQRTIYAQQTDVFTEYALGAIAIAPGMSADDVTMLVEALLKQNPKSAYLEMTASSYLNSILKRDGPEAQMRGAARLLVILPQCEDALLVLAEGEFAASNEKEAIEFATRLVNTLTSKPKPEFAPEAEWLRKKETLLARGYYIAGVSSCLAEAWTDCDRNLHAAEPMVNAQSGMQSPLYFYLGLSNYRLAQPAKDKARLQLALEYGKKSAAIAGPMQGSAKQNVTVMERALAAFK